MDSDSWQLRPGERISVRRRLADGGQTDAIGYLVEVDPTRLLVEDRRGGLITIERESILALRRVAPALGRDPASAPDELLAELLGRAGLRGEGRRVRISDLLADQVPPATVFHERGTWTDGRYRARVEGEWLITDAPTGPLLIALTWWAARQGARSVLQVTPG
ncbi:MAG: hypothetical protein WAS07_05990 [Micropruina sp.]